MVKQLMEDAKNILERDPAARSLIQVILLYPGWKILFWHRISHYFYNLGSNIISGLISQYARRRTGIEIHPGAQIGSRLFIDHGMGVVIGETAVVGDDVTMYHGVTLGGTGGEAGVRRHPIIGNGVIIGSGAKILGSVSVGAAARIGANSVVLRDIPPGATAVGVPARIVDRHEKHHIHAI